MALIVEHNCLTGEVIEREMNSQELQQKELDKIQAQRVKDALAEAATKKTIAEAKLAALGLTSDDLKALGLGGTL